MEDEVIQLYYDKAKNVMIDEDGYIMFDLFRMISPSQYHLFLRNQEYTLIQTRPGYYVELVWPEVDDGDWEGYNYYGYA